MQWKGKYTQSRIIEGGVPGPSKQEASNNLVKQKPKVARPVTSKTKGKENFPARKPKLPPVVLKQWQWKKLHEEGNKLKANAVDSEVNIQPETTDDFRSC